MNTITGTVTKSKLAAWVAINRSDLALDDINGTKGFYRKDYGQIRFNACGASWKHVAIQLGAV